MMGGNGTRFGAPVPKQFTVVGNKSIFEFIIDAYDSTDLVDLIAIICNPQWVEYANNIIVKKKLKKKVIIVGGGKTRSNSIKNGLLSIKQLTRPEDCILIHDATHPYLDEIAVTKALDLMNKFDGVTLCQPEYDTCYYIEDDLIKMEIPKKSVVSGASPEIFRFKDLENMYTKATDEKLEAMSSAGALALSYGLRIGVVPSPILNIKITHASDLELFRNLYSTYYFKG